jgi:hypothetical protein
MTLFLHETHRVKGKREEEFEALYRDPGGWMELLGRGDDARLMWFAHQAHGTGPAYRVVTVTAIDDGAAWERLSRRTHDGDLAEWTRRIDDCRHDVRGKLVTPVRWSPIHDVDLAEVDATPADHEPTLFMEDTGWPDVTIDEYVDFWETGYWPVLESAPEGMRLLEIQACWVTMLGAGLRPEGILWQRIHNMDRLLGLLANEVAPQLRGPGTYMANALEYRDQWESRLLRTAPWSPRW